MKLVIKKMIKFESLEIKKFLYVFMINTRNIYKRKCFDVKPNFIRIIVKILN